MTDNILEEISRIYASETKSQFETDIQEEILQWARNRNIQGLGMKALSSMFWKEKLR
jgi:hypothetical protein